MTKRIAIVTDSNSGITQSEANEMGLTVIPMPFMINDDEFFEDINLTQDAFYEKLESNASVITSQPSPETVTTTWNQVLNDYDELVHIPMSSGLSGAYQTAVLLAEDYQGRVQVVNNQRISVTLRQACLDALQLAKTEENAQRIKQILEDDKFNSSIYIMLDTLSYLKKGGRITPAAAAIGTLLRIKPVLQIQGEKLDAFAKARTSAQGKLTMISAIRKDMETRFGGATPDNIWLEVAYTKDRNAADAFATELENEFPGFEIYTAPLSLSVACHIGPGSLAVACCKKIKL